jgi:hypothetical protein
MDFVPAKKQPAQHDMISQNEHVFMRVKGCVKNASILGRLMNGQTIESPIVQIGIITRTVTCSVKFPFMKAQRAQAAKAEQTKKLFETRKQNKTLEISIHWGK